MSASLARDDPVAITARLTLRTVYGRYMSKNTVRAYTLLRCHLLGPLIDIVADNLRSLVHNSDTFESVTAAASGTYAHGMFIDLYPSFLLFEYIC
jgi:hypothetical protein